MAGSSGREPSTFGAAGRNKGLVALVAIGLVLLAAIGAFFQALYTRQSSAAASIREDALWATYQTDREVRRLALALTELVDGRPEASLAEVSRRFDILYSRHEVMEEADFPGKFRSDSRLRDLTADMSVRLHRILPAFDRFVAEKRADAAVLAEVLGEVRELGKVTERLLVATNQVQLAIQVDDRGEISRIYASLAAAVGGLMLAMGAVIVVIWRQLRQIEVSRFRLQRLSEELALSAAAAEAGNKAKSAFLATMSHEIRTPLNGIIGTAELMDSGRLDREQLDQLSTIRQCSDALIALINDILDFSKLESGTIDLERREVALAEVVDGVIEMLAPQAEAKGLDLVASHPSCRCVTDPVRLRQVLINLVGNALKFTDYGTVTVRFWELGRDGDHTVLRVQVEDTGIGIAPEAVGRLFAEFSQADASINRRFGGTGLGLAIARRIVEALGGTIGVESFEGKGTIFWFEIPVERRGSDDDRHLGNGLSASVVATSPKIAAPIERDLASLGLRIEPAWRNAAAVDLLFVDVATWEKRRGTAEAIDPARAVVFGFGARAFEHEVAAVLDGAVTSRRLTRLVTHRVRGTVPAPSEEDARAKPSERRFSGRVLVAEDNAVNRKVAVGILTRMGLVAETVVDGLQAVERLAKGGIDLVLMDMQMPVMNGLEATEKIRADGGDARDVPIVGLTANAFASDRAACLAAGMNDFVMKPVTRERLEAALAPLLPEADPQTCTPDPRRGGPTASEVAAAVGAAAGAVDDAIAPERTAVQVLDHGLRRHLAAQIGEDGVAELTEVFVADAAALLAELGEAQAAGDQERLRRVLHTLTGAAANVGCSGVVAAIAAIRAADGQDRPDLVGGIGAAVLAARTALAAETAVAAAA